jgi:hypothetical protein
MIYGGLHWELGVLGREGGASGRGFGLRDGLMVLMLKVGLIWKFTALLQVVEC